MLDPVVEAIHREVAELGTLERVAERHALSHEHLCRIANGRLVPGSRVRRIFTGHKCRARPRHDRPISHEALRLYLEAQAIDFGGGCRILSRELGIDERHIARVLAGKRQIGPILAAKLGYRQVTMYERK